MSEYPDFIIKLVETDMVRGRFYRPFVIDKQAPVMSMLNPECLVEFANDLENDAKKCRELAIKAEEEAKKSMKIVEDIRYMIKVVAEKKARDAQAAEQAEIEEVAQDFLKSFKTTVNAIAAADPNYQEFCSDSDDDEDSNDTGRHLVNVAAVHIVVKRYGFTFEGTFLEYPENDDKARDMRLCLTIRDCNGPLSDALLQVIIDGDDDLKNCNFKNCNVEQLGPILKWMKQHKVG
jgi:hypothetical protein